MMTHIKEVTVEFGATINLGNYENMRLGVQIKADMDAGDIDSGDLNALLEDARKELAFGLWDMADAKLRAVEKWEHEDESERNQGRAIGFSNEYRWMVKLHPEMAAEMLANVVADYWEAKRPAMPVVLPELAKQINEGMKAAARSLSAALGVPADVLTGDETPPPNPLPASGEGEYAPDDEPDDDKPTTYYMPWRGAFHPDGFDDDDEPEDDLHEHLISEDTNSDLDDEPEDEPDEPNDSHYRLLNEDGLQPGEVADTL